LEFLKQLKLLAQEEFNFTMEDGLVGGILGPSSVDLQPLLMDLWAVSVPCSLNHLSIPWSPLFSLSVVSVSRLLLEGDNGKHNPEPEVLIYKMEMICPDLSA
jgi:hypothetical protein